MNNGTTWTSARRVIRARDVEIIDLAGDDDEIIDLTGDDGARDSSSGRSLDSLESSLDASMAKEHFDNAIEGMNSGKTVYGIGW